MASESIQADDFASKPSSSHGKLQALPLEVRREIYSRLIDERYEQTYDFTAEGNIRIIKATSHPVPRFLCANKILTAEMTDALMLGRQCEIRVQQNRIVTNFPLHKLGNDRLLTACRFFGTVHGCFWGDRCRFFHGNNTDMRKQLTVPTCKRINVTIVPPSPRNGWDFYQTRKTVQELIFLLNSQCRDLNPQVCIDLDWTDKHSTSYYGDFAMFMGPFVSLNNRCKAIMLYRTSVIPAYNDGVTRYCNLIEVAMKGNAKAKDELTRHQLQLDLKLPIAFHGYGTSHKIPELTKQNDLLYSEPCGAITPAVVALRDWLLTHSMPLPSWLVELHIHCVGGAVSDYGIRRINRLLGEAGLFDNATLLWAAGFFSRYNPFFDDTSLFTQHCLT